MLDIRTEITTKTRWSGYQALHIIVEIKSTEKNLQEAYIQRVAL